MQNKEVIISSGNILNKTITWRKGNEAVSDELYESLKACILQQQAIKDQTWTHADICEFLGEQAEDNDEVIDRQDLKVTVKLFLYSLNRDDVIAAIHRGLKNTSVDHLDTLVFSFSGQSDTTRLSLEMVKDVWSVLEEMVGSGTAKMIGLCDVDTQLFVQLYAWARIKPSIIQINLASCCVVPPDLSEFCKLHSIQLLTHSDPINILPDEKLESLLIPFQTCLNNGNGEENTVKWQAKWVLRYQIHLKCRGVLSTKGYVAAVVGILA